ncbi:MAG: GTPase Era [Mollicutes bacterium]|nr:GTPase Era [Mollicutes bacterium]
MKSGFVSIIGRPNTGKSTLLNTILNNHIAIVSDVAGTTRNTIQGVYNDEDTQIVFIDTPGIHKPKDKLGKYLNRQSYNALHDIDVILFIVDASQGIGKGDKFIIDSFKNTELPVILVLNKIDKLNDEGIIKAISESKDLYNFAEIIPISAKKNDNVNRLLKVIKKYLTDNIIYYDDGTITNTSIYFMISELVREKILNLTTEEVPHSVTCATTYYKDKGHIVDIYVDIIIDRDSLKKIIIGKQGTMLKNIGALARRDIENLLGKQVYLELFVKTIKSWRDKEKYLQELGFKEQE